MHRQKRYLTAWAAVSMPPSNVSLHNSNASDKTNSKLTPTLDAPAEVPVDKSGIPASSLGPGGHAIARPSATA